MAGKQAETLFYTLQFRRYFRELVKNTRLRQMEEYPQHGNTSRLLHSVAVAYYSYRLALFTGRRFHWSEMVRGALLHDYFFYNAQDGDPAHKGHWSRHPAIAAENAGKELLLSEIEEDVIRAHMFPLTPHPPRFREGAVVSLVDKGCSVYEFFRRNAPYRRLRREILENAIK